MKNTDANPKEESKSSKEHISTIKADQEMYEELEKLLN